MSLELEQKSSHQPLPSNPDSQLTLASRDVQVASRANLSTEKNLKTDFTEEHNLRSETPPNTEVDYAAIESAVKTILTAVGEDANRDGLLETPRRVAKMYAEMFSGLKQDPSRHLQKTFEVECGELVLIRDIEFTSMCEHHLLPFSGHAHVAYIPTNRVGGLSKFGRVVEEIARRPQVQERMTNQIANLIESELETMGVAVVVQAEHSCMAIRGIRKRGSSTITSSLRGVFKTDPASRAEVMSLINSGS